MRAVWRSEHNNTEAVFSGHCRTQGKGGLYYAGAWAGYGFHEDGLKAGIAVAAALGASIPWTPRATSPKTSLLDNFFVFTFDRFARAAITAGRLRLILPNGKELVYGSDASAQQHAPAKGALGNVAWVRQTAPGTLHSFSSSPAVWVFGMSGVRPCEWTGVWGILMRMTLRRVRLLLWGHICVASCLVYGVSGVRPCRRMGALDDMRRPTCDTKFSLGRG